MTTTLIFAPRDGFLVYLAAGWTFANAIAQPAPGSHGHWSCLMSLETVWMTVPDWPGYRVSNLGDVISPNGTKLKPFLDNDGYLRVRVRHKDMPPKSFKRAPVHTLVCSSFHGSRPDGCQVAHFDGNRLNNSPLNLYWATGRQNSADAIRHGTLAYGERSHFSKLSRTQADQVRKMRREGRTCREIAALFNVSEDCVSTICRSTKRRQENGLKIIIGSRRGEESGTSKLTESEVVSARAEYERGASQRQLCKKYKVGANTMHCLLTRKTWKHV